MSTLAAFACPACDGLGVVAARVRRPPALPVSPCDLERETSCGACDDGEVDEADCSVCGETVARTEPHHVCKGQLQCTKCAADRGNHFDGCSSLLTGRTNMDSNTNTSTPLCGDCHLPADEHGLCPACDARIPNVGSRGVVIDTRREMKKLDAEVHNAAAALTDEVERGAGRVSLDKAIDRVVRAVNAWAQRPADAA